MIFYQIQDKRSGLWFRQGYLEWELSIQTRAFVCCTLPAAQAALDAIVKCRAKRRVQFSRDEVDLVPIDTEAGTKVLRKLFAITDPAELTPYIAGPYWKRVAWRNACAEGQRLV